MSVKRSTAILLAHCGVVILVCAASASIHRSSAFAAARGVLSTYGGDVDPTTSTNC